MKDESKFCRKCNVALDNNNTYASRIKGKSNICKECNKKEVAIVRQSNMRNWLSRALLRAKHSTKERNNKGKDHIFNLTIDELLTLLEKQQGKCAISGIELAHLHNDWKSASIDRIDNKVGYTVDNVRLVCYGANIAMARLTEQEFIGLCKAVVSHNL